MRKRKQSEQLKPSETLKKRKQLQKRTHLPPSPPLPELPNDVIVEILSRLPVDALFRFRCVCRSWYGLVRDPRFIKMQANRAIENENPKILIPSPYKLFFLEFKSHYRTSRVNLHPPCKEPILFLASYNGLICYKVKGKRDIYLWNPSTRDNKRLPDIPSPASNYREFFFIGYSSARDEYKIVMIIPFLDQEVWVLTLGALSWRRVERSRSRVNPGGGVCINGALHWTVSPTEAKTPHVIAFDLDDEKFREMLLPDFGNMKIHYWKVMVGEHLTVECDCLDGGFCEIWVMNEYGNEKSWIKKFSQMHTKKVGTLQILGSLKTGDIFLKWKNRFGLYHPVDGRIRKLPTRATLDHSEVYNYVKTLIWPVGDA